MAKTKRELVNFTRRQCNVTNLNYAPEKSGQDLVEAVDLAIDVLLEDLDLDALVRVRNGVNVLKTLWDAKGNIALLDVTQLPIDFKAVGKATLAQVTDEKDIAFDGAVWTFKRIEPLNGFKATLKCSLRIHPGGHLEELGRMRLRETAMFGFTGAQGEPEGEKQQGLEV